MFVLLARGIRRDFRVRAMAVDDGTSSISVTGMCFGMDRDVLSILSCCQVRVRPFTIREAAQL